MPRNLRTISETQVYHVMVRGVNKQDIFVDNDDRLMLISLLKKTKKKYNFNIYSYVLMDNHIHLEFKDDENCISKIIHNLTTSYAIYFNKKYDRVGHLFQDRFKSKPVENDEYLINLVRYIHQNPEKARIELTQKYRWSSYFDYINQKSDLVDINFILNILNKNRNEALKKFKQIHKSLIELTSSEEILEFEIKTQLDDNELQKVIENLLGKEKMINIKKYKRKELKIELLKLTKIKGATATRIANILGIERKIVSELLKGCPKIGKNNQLGSVPERRIYGEG